MRFDFRIDRQEIVEKGEVLEPDGKREGLGNPPANRFCIVREGERVVAMKLPQENNKEPAQRRGASQR
jgi:hypothetical protein